ncbi:hypothetical protein F2P44_26770 [Massilia sp. CCM 8695]|uniref:Uncharacterized protein n=1 Tax=Massilia frigida TaxID=2609281 RepID=A0ABX0NHQ1_9BURK|nr:hypothetical protein [Massilia frigida]NHZ82849.1 hypothetical protein [Massilia frigida]
MNYGYVFLANRESHEGLKEAAAVINKLKEHTAHVMPETVVTITADSSFVQLVKTGQTAAIFPDGPQRKDAAPLWREPRPCFPARRRATRR